MYREGDYKVQCDRTGMTFYASECRKQWNGLFVNNKSWEARHPQDFVRGRVDKQTVPICRPRGFKFIEV